MAFRIQPRTRLHEWVADDAGFFRDEGAAPGAVPYDEAVLA